jgi:hypothetical protein
MTQNEWCEQVQQVREKDRRQPKIKIIWFSKTWTVY